MELNLHSNLFEHMFHCPGGAHFNTVAAVAAKGFIYPNGSFENRYRVFGTNPGTSAAEIAVMTYSGS